MHEALLDDAWITLAYARNVAEHGCWCVTPGLWSNTATSPLWVVLLAGPMLLVGPVVALGLVTAATMGVAAGAVSSLAGRMGWSAVAGPAAAALLASAPLVQASVGLESLLAVTVLVVAARELALGRTVGVGLAAGALVLVRNDLGLVAVLAVALAAVAARSWRPLVVAAASAAAVVVPWLLISLAWFGSVLPDTLVWKQAPLMKAGLGGYMYGEAVVLFARVWPVETWLSLAGAGAGIIAACWLLWRAPRRPPIVLLAVGGASHALTLVVLDVAPYPWYPAPALGVALVLLALAVGAPGVGRWIAGAAALGLVVAGVAYTVDRDYAGRGAPFNYNRATPAQYAAVVDRVPDGAVLETYEELGAVAFFCGDRCTVVDPLSDRGRLAPLIVDRLDRSPWLRVAYPGWRPTAAVPATHRVVVHQGGVATWSDYGGEATMDVRPVR